MNSAKNQKSLRERKKESCRQNIYQAAVRLFLSKGFEQTTVDEIVVEADVSKATFFNYFARKEDIVRYYADEMFRAIKEKWETADISQASSSIDQLRNMFEMLIDLYESRKDEVRLLLWRRGNILAQDENLPLESHLVMMGILDQTISEGQKKGEIRSDIEAGVMAEDLFIIVLYNLAKWSLSGTKQEFLDQIAHTLKLLEKPIT